MTPTHVVAPADIMTATDVVAPTALPPVAAVAVPGATGAPGEGVDQAAVLVAQRPAAQIHRAAGVVGDLTAPGVVGPQTDRFGLSFPGQA
ncbi:hypothetical protein ACFXKC_43080 [Streptomyces sp. NPDC059340]|uniref:hypothetical protein n=1 Tax=Streptomyces sp. NPDC059340 TaxID=3346806 RepID=UPI0036A726D2